MQVSVRLPLPVYRVMQQRGPVAGQLVALARAALFADGSIPEPWPPAADASRVVRP